MCDVMPPQVNHINISNTCGNYDQKFERKKFRQMRLREKD
jgi:hypothetical protein